VIAVETSRDKLTNEAWTALDVLNIGIQVEGFAIVHK